MFGYEIREGVRRSVAAREAGLLDIPAVLVEPGHPDVHIRVPLADLFSPKPLIARDYRYVRGCEYPTAVLGTEPPPIFVVRITTPGRMRQLDAPRQRPIDLRPP